MRLMTQEEEVRWRVEAIAEAKQVYQEYLNGTRKLGQYELIEYYAGQIEMYELCLANYLRDHYKPAKQLKLF